LVSQPRQAEVWWAEAEDKRRPVLIVTRSEAIPVLSRVVVAPVTRTVRGIPTEIALGEEEGLPAEGAASFDNLQPINRHLLTERLGELPGARRHELCQALDALADC
jgi:mRNA interferase MazF